MRTSRSGLHRVRALQPTSDPNAPAATQVLVERLEAAVGLPMHAPRLGREAIIETKRPLFAPVVLEQLPYTPSPAAEPQRLALILRLILGAPADAATESRPAIDDPAAAIA